MQDVKSAQHDLEPADRAEFGRAAQWFGPEEEPRLQRHSNLVARYAVAIVMLSSSLALGLWIVLGMP